MNCTKVLLISGLHVFVTVQASSAGMLKALQKQQPGGTQAHSVDGFEFDVSANGLGDKTNSTGTYTLLVTPPQQMQPEAAFTADGMPLPGNRGAEEADKAEGFELLQAPEIKPSIADHNDNQSSIATHLATGVQFLWGLLWSLED